jgi:hypothetical protein
MADILISMGQVDELSIDQYKPSDPACFKLSNSCCCNIYGKSRTYNIVQEKEDLIIAIGYISLLDGVSIQETLSRILKTFHESQIIDLKRRLIGEYILLIKKNGSIHIFSDFMGVRNIFYSTDGKFVASSYTLLEDLKETRTTDLDIFKLYEFIAMGHSIYPSWLGRSTYHKCINWLRPNEYLVIDKEKGNLRLCPISYHIDNEKQSNISLLSDELLSVLGKILARQEFKDQKVAASLTGGHDSRLIAAIAANEFPNLRFRIAASSKNDDSLKDLKVASNLARAQGIPLDVFWFQPGIDEARFIKQTEGFSPVFNNTMAPLLDGAGTCSLGLGGAFGTELFMPIRWKSIEEFINTKINRAKQALMVGDEFWDIFRGSLYKDFDEIKKYYILNNNDERDYIRLFYLTATARYGSFILSAFNQAGFQLDPYANYPVLELALRVSPVLWGDHRKLKGNSLVQKDAMAKVNPRMGRLTTYGYYRPMLPLSPKTFLRYLLGYTLHIISYFLMNKFPGKVSLPKKSNLPGGGYYLSNGWENSFLRRTAEKYGLMVKPSINQN